MRHSTVTSKGQTTIPGEIRAALKIKPGDRLEYTIEGNHATIRVHPGLRSLKGMLASDKGKEMSFAQIRDLAARAARRRGGHLMIERRLVDTNLIVRHLVQDHEKHAKAAGKLFEACDRGEVVVVVLPAVFAECVFVLESFYKHARTDISAALKSLMTSPGVEIDNPAIHLDALQRYHKAKAHFVDCLIAATAAAKNISVATFDQDFRKFPDVRVEIE